MAFLEINAPWRAWRPFPWVFKNSHKAEQRLDQVPKDISAHIAADIGLSEHDLEVLRHEWPSRSVNGGIGGHRL